VETSTNSLQPSNIFIFIFPTYSELAKTHILLQRKNLNRSYIYVTKYEDMCHGNFRNHRQYMLRISQKTVTIPPNGNPSAFG
jgi:hypothetical protein